MRAVNYAGTLGFEDTRALFFAFDHEDVAACPFDHRGSIGADETLTGGPVVCFEEPRRLKDLGSLHRPEIPRIAGDPPVFDPDGARRDR